MTAEATALKSKCLEDADKSLRDSALLYGQALERVRRGANTALLDDASELLRARAIQYVEQVFRCGRTSK